MEKKSPVKFPAFATYKRLRRGAYFADFRRDLRQQPDVYHCLIQRDGSNFILGWTQHRTLEAAVHAAEQELARLAKKEKNKSDLPRAI